MKNFINYYYNLNIFNIHQRGKDYYFKINDEIYSFVMIVDISELNDIFKLSEYLNKNDNSFHKIIININNQIITKINEKNYILLKLGNVTKEIEINKIIEITKCW